MSSGHGNPPEWLRVGHRLELTLLAVCIVTSVVMGLASTLGKPSGTPGLWVGWVFAGGFAFFSSAISLLAAHFVKRSWTPSQARRRETPPNLSSRLALYFVMLVLAVMLSSRLAQFALSRHMSLTWVLWIFIVDLAILILLVILNEVKVWRKRKNSHT